MIILDFATKTFPPCTMEQIQEGEQRIGIPFPEWYVEFLLQSNGAQYEYGSVGEETVPFLGFLGLEDSINVFEEYGEFDFFPIGSCDGFALICVDTKSNKFYYFDVELSEKKYLADTISELVELINHESYNYNLRVKTELGEITLEEYHKLLLKTNS